MPGGAAVGVREELCHAKAAYGVVAFMVLQAASVLAMGGVMLWRDDPAASAGFFYALAPITLALLACTMALLRSYVVQGPIAAPTPSGA